jgi:hypothetical protein
METIHRWTEMIFKPLNDMGFNFVALIQKLGAAILVLIIGWLITKLIVKLVTRILKLVKADKIDDKLNEINLFGSKELNFNVISIVANFVKWIMYILLIIIIAEILNLKIISEEVGNMLRYLPQLFSALVIFTIGLLVANTVKKAIKSFFESMELSGAKVISQGVFILILVFISITSLNQAGVDTTIITSNITLLIGGFVLAFALAFGLGAQKIVHDLLKAFYARKTYEIGQHIKVGNIEGSVVSIDSISVTINSIKGKIVVPIKDLVEQQVTIVS